MKVLVTGASGFIGRALCKLLLEREYEVVGLTRSSNAPDTGVRYVVTDLESSGSIDKALMGVDVVVHLAGRAHVLHERHALPLELFRKVNRDMTLYLAKAAMNAGVKRFIMMSSIGVNGGETGNKPFDEASLPSPQADYAKSKLEAEQGLQKMLSGSSVECVIIRPPLVYGAAAPGNFARLLRIVALGIPLPLGAVTNRRSLVALENLVDFVEICIRHPAASNQLFVIADGEDFSTADILRAIASGMERRIWLPRIPQKVLYMGSKLLGKTGIYKQLCGSLCIDASKARKILGWSPRIQPREAMRLAGENYLSGIRLRK